MIAGQEAVAVPVINMTLCARGGGKCNGWQRYTSHKSDRKREFMQVHVSGIIAELPLNRHPSVRSRCHLWVTSALEILLRNRPRTGATA